MSETEPIPSLYMIAVPYDSAISLEASGKAVIPRPYGVIHRRKTGLVYCYFLPNFSLVISDGFGIYWTTPDDWIKQALEFAQEKRKAKGL